MPPNFSIRNTDTAKSLNNFAKYITSSKTNPDHEGALICELSISGQHVMNLAHDEEVIEDKYADFINF